MDRALSLKLLTSALGEHARLPSPEALQRLLSEAEVNLFTNRARLEPQLLDSGWYLQSVATARKDLDLYGIERQRQAHQVSAHIFDLALQTSNLMRLDALQYTFAAQIAYMGGELTPNAAALARRHEIVRVPEQLEDPGIVSLEAGVLLLALDRPALYPLLDRRITQFDNLAAEFGDISDSQYASADGVIRGVRDLTSYLTYGNREVLSRARMHFWRALESREAPSDIESRWVAAHLLRMSDDLETSSVWSVLPPNLPSVARAMTLGDPPVLQLWPPQLSFLTDGEPGEPSPLDPSVRRVILSFPTSAGKSLLAQLFVTSHVVGGKGDVCVVAPTHSLCREISASLRRRLRTLGQHLYIEPPLGLGEAKPAGARVSVMTPEKLASRLRSDPAGLLEEFGMFVIDEAHLVADPERGWRLEETLSLLNHVTKATHHRILVLSAALGSQAHVMAWLDAGHGVIARHNDWRGPRRLSVIFTTRPDWDSESYEEPQGPRGARRIIPLVGIVHLRTGLAGKIAKGQFSKPVGNLVLRQKRNGDWTRDGQSTTQRAQLLPLIRHIQHTGPVLVIEATKSSAQRLAEEIADSRNEGPSTLALADLVRTRLGQEHPLARVIPKGVAFHHAALPVDIQSEIEDAVRSEQINCLVATTTLTEGINLPFKSVVVAQRGFRDSDGIVEVVDDARLINAVGRAGRAGRETEGWLILAEQQAFHSSMFEPLNKTAIDLEMQSTMVSVAALEQIAILEEATRTSEDAIFTSIGPEANGFVRSVWLIAQALSELSSSPSDEEVLEVIKATLAWQQLDETGKERFMKVASRANRAFSEQPVERRKRWAHSGMSLPSAASLEVVAEEVFGMITQDVAQSEPPQAIAEILGHGRLARLLELSENQRRGFKVSRNSPRDELLPVDLMAVLIDWVSGVDLYELADTHIGAVGNEDYRYEQLAEFVASVFEHYLPWALGTLVDWVNDALQAKPTSFKVPDDLAAAVHYGVATRDALSLMQGGIRSRRLANRVAESRAELEPGSSKTPLRDWIASQDISIWRSRFDASATEVADLLAFSRDPSVQLVNKVLEGEDYVLSYVERAAVLFESEASLAYEPDQPTPAPLVILVNSEIVGTIGPEHYDDVSLLSGIGIPLDIRVRPLTSGCVLLLRLASEVKD